jgi:hypothetical protein
MWRPFKRASAEVPTSPVLSIHPAGMLLDLRWRSGLVPLARSSG